MKPLTEKEAWKLVIEKLDCRIDSGDTWTNGICGYICKLEEGGHITHEMYCRMMRRIREVLNRRKANRRTYLYETNGPECLTKRIAWIERLLQRI